MNDSKIEESASAESEDTPRRSTRDRKRKDSSTAALAAVTATPATGTGTGGAAERSSTDKSLIDISSSSLPVSHRLVIIAVFSHLQGSSN